MIVVAAKAPSHRSSTFVFRTWINNTGWENNVVCFITGLVNPLYSLGGLDGVSHITEEMPNPSRNAPLAVGMSNSASIFAMLLAI
jgi:choline transport protein